MASNQLRLLLDESITDQLAGLIMELVSSAIYIRDLAGKRGMKDPQVAALADELNRMIVAVDGDFKRKITAKQGVIKMNKARNDDECLFASFRAFWQSGHRRRAKQRRTFLTHEGIRIENGEPFIAKWDEHPCPNRAQR
jgi:hypothetical protein